MVMRTYLHLLSFVFSNVSESSFPELGGAILTSMIDPLTLQVSSSSYEVLVLTLYLLYQKRIDLIDIYKTTTLTLIGASSVT